MVDLAINEIVVQLVDYDISEWKMDGEDDDSQDNLADVDNDGPPIRKLFVGNISERTTYTELRKLFKYYGKVIDAHISRDKYTHSKKNFGFVTFKNPEDAKRVLKLKQGELRLHLRNLYVAPADSWHQPKELPDGTVLWNTKRKPSSTDTWSRSEMATSSGTDSAIDEQELGAVGGCTSQSVKKEQEEEANKNESGNENGDSTEDRECKINILNDDCLMHIFSFLDKVERIKIERVCKRWQTICLDMWLSQKFFDFTFIYPRYLDRHIFEAYLKRCGSNLQSLDLSHKPAKLSAHIHRTIAMYCTNLRCLNLNGLPLTSIGLQHLGSVCKELRVLNLDRCSGLLDRDLQNFFKKCPHLESVSLTHNSGLTGKCLHGLARAPVKHLILDECNNLRSKNLVNVLLGLKHLSHLSLNSCIDLTNCDVVNIVRAAPKLRSLSMARYFPLFNGTALKPLASLHDLVSLNLQLNPAVNDHIMEVIAENCKKIEDLNLTGCSINSWESQSLTNDGVKCLASLPHLIKLSMSYLANVSDEALQAVARKGRLRSVVCRGCPTFTDVGCISVVTYCNELEKFDFSGCDLVSKATVRAALESVKLRTNDIKLTLIVGGTGASEDPINEKYPLLEVDYSNLCVSHLRPDYVDEIYFPASDDEDEDLDFLEEDLSDWELECNPVVYGDDLEYYDDFFDITENCGFRPQLYLM